eukprot:COSAG04_NODE_10279_length_790_cov_1.331404_2_plen_43_part_01
MPTTRGRCEVWAGAYGAGLATDRRKPLLRIQDDGDFGLCSSPW